MATIIDGRSIAATLRASYASRVDRLRAAAIEPGLAVILVGNNPASELYVSNKVKACREIGISSRLIRLHHAIAQDELLSHIDALNRDASVHGILIQLPLPAHLEVGPVLQAIAREKDVDGFHLYNVGALTTGHPAFAPCTPQAVMEMLRFENIPVSGKNMVVVGASNIVGKPMALLAMHAGATVSVCHALTRDLGQYTILADILVVAVGRPRLIVPQMVKTGVVVIDVGINRMPDGSIVGDVDFEAVKEKASFISPVPGGVGPMTITMLLANTLSSAERAIAVELAASI